MPGSALLGLGLLDEEVIVIEPHVLARHEFASDRRSGRRADELLVFRDPLPVAEVLDEPSGVALLARYGDEGAGIRQVAVDARADEVDLLGREAAPDDDRTIERVVGDGLRIDVRHGGRVAPWAESPPATTPVRRGHERARQGCPRDFVRRCG